MSPPRSQKAKARPAPAPDPPRRPGTGARLLSLPQEKPLETLGALGALGATLGAVVSGVRAETYSSSAHYADGQAVG